jgi:hypothetical protein
MTSIMDSPVLVFTFSFFVLWMSALFGAGLLRRFRPLEKNEQADFGVVQAANLTLLGLLVGFTFSMAISRYEQRKTLEEAEANAIGTEYLRANLLPPSDGVAVRDLLTNYLGQRILFYATRDKQQLQQIDITTAKLQNELWSSVQACATAHPTPVVALAVSGMNDVLNSQGYTQAAWWNRIPLEAWVLLIVIGIGCNVLIGYGAHRPSFLFIIVPLAVSASLFLIADIDSPRGGVIRVQPQNLVSLSQELRAPQTR